MTSTHADLHIAIQRERRHLVSLAYRLLGTLAATERIVQETYMCWYLLTPAQQERIAEPRAWLTRMLSRLCFDALVSEDCFDGLSPSDAANASPAERMVLILHDDFAMDFEEVAQIVGRTPDACRRLALATRRRTQLDRAERMAREIRDDLIRAYVSAAGQCDVAAMVALSDPFLELKADGVETGHRPTAQISGARQVAQHLVRPLRSFPDTMVLVQETSEGLGFGLWEDGCIVGAAKADVAGGVVTSLRLATVPGRLTRWS